MFEHNGYPVTAPEPRGTPGLHATLAPDVTTGETATPEPPATSGEHANSGAHAMPGHGGSSLRVLIWAALGVVFGDIGTSPLYAMSETVSSHLVATKGIKDKVT